MRSERGEGKRRVEEEGEVVEVFFKERRTGTGGGHGRVTVWGILEEEEEVVEEEEEVGTVVGG